MIITALTVDHLAAVRELMTLGAPYIRARDLSDYWLYANLFSNTARWPWTRMAGYAVR